ncbi:MAG: imidazole glycerol phosphate synthase subunit HisH [Deltaproteobacteria bacterium]|nr:imidazole glycerol phosphate synthase subunit HisH [Deltaproteobacteria bacterium]
MIAIIDYKAGNLTSVKRALDFIGEVSIVTGDYSEVNDCDRIIFPGVGAAGNAICDLRVNDLDKAIMSAYENGKPILGICLGTQIIMEWSQENNTKCLGLIKGNVLRFPDEFSDSENKRLKVPHMGWNEVNLLRDHPVFHGIPEGTEFYFVHSYYPSPSDQFNIIGETDYGIKFASVISSGNLLAVQFHPEKSGRPGLRILENFSNWNGKGYAQ